MIVCCTFVSRVCAQTVPASDSLIAFSDTLVADSFPKWHVAPEIPLPLRAPRRATAAANCPLDSILTFNIDSVLVEVTIYGYDAAGHVCNQEVWTVKADGTRVGKEKKEYGYTGSRQTMTAVYTWDAAANAWKGTEKSEYTYSGSRMTSNTSFVWLNSAWVADKKYTYAYDASGRETEYFEYKRNTTNNQLEPVNGFVYVWIDETQKSLEEIYTTYSNGAWNAGTKKEWAFDAEGRQTLYAYYSTITNGQWIGTSKEEWAYTDSILTMHATYGWASGNWAGTLKEVWGYDSEGRTILREQYGWYNHDWAITLREKAAFDEAGHQILIENYTGSNGVTTGTKKEEYTFNGDILTTTVKYAWSGGAWIGSSKETWEYNASGKLTLHEQFGWANNDWSKTLREETEYFGSLVIRIENYTYANGVPTGTKKETTTYTDGYRTEFVTYAWSNGAWIGSTREIWEYNSPLHAQTLHEQYTWANNAWSKTLREETEYLDEIHVSRIENYTYADDVPTGTKKETSTYDATGKKTEFIKYTWDTDRWVGSEKETWAFNEKGKQTLHESYKWGESGWSRTLKEEKQYQNYTLLVRVENYTYDNNGVPTGTKKETYAYTSNKKTEEVIYAWDTDHWVESTKERWEYTSSKETLHEQYIWNGAWVKTLEENTAYTGSNITGIENYALIEGVWTGTKKEDYTYEGGKKTQETIYAWDATIPNWTFATFETWTYTSGQLTLHEKSEYDGTNWNITTQEKTTYDGATIVGIENYVFANGSWTVQKEDYVYSGGQKTETIVYAYSGGTWVKSTRSVIGYQEGNTTISATNYTWGGDAWVGSGNRTSTTYDDANRVVELLTQNWPEGATEWTNASITTHTFNANGEDILTYNGTWNGTRWAVSSMTRLDYIFDSENRQLLKASWKCGSDSNWIGIEKDTSYYSATGKLKYRAKYKGWKNNDWIPVSYTENEYDSEDRALLEQSYKWSNNKWQGVYRYEYAYDEQGRRTANTKYSGWNTSTNSWKGSSKQEYVFYKNYTDKYESMTTYSWNNNQWNPSSRNIYSYDSSDREIEQILQGYSLTKKAWINISKHEKEYNGNKLVKDNEYAWSNNQWAIRSQKEWQYDTDAQAKLRREIVGTWTSAGLTSYADNYHSYACDIRYYTIRFVNYDGTLLASAKWEEGTTPVYSGATPTKPADAQYTYTYAGWNKTIVAATADATYTATYSTTVNSYTITFLNDDGTQLQSGKIAYGQLPEYTGAKPTKQATGQYTYVFSGWDPIITTVTGDATYTATYTNTQNQYTISWRNWDNSLIDQATLTYGAMPSHEDIERENTAEWTYTFAGWKPEVISVIGDAAYTAVFDSVKNNYTVSWFNWDHSSIDQTTVAYGVVPSHEDAERENTAEWTYTFAGWTPEIISVTGDAAYTAVFDSTRNGYTVSWLNWDNSLIDQTTVPYGDMPTHDAPSKQATAEWTYTFASWDPEIVSVTGDAVYTATYDSARNSYTITWLNDDGTEINHETLEYGATPTHANPSKEATAQYTYTFAGWTPEIADVTGDRAYTALYDSTVNSYTVIFYDEDGATVLDSREWEYGAMPECAEPTKEATAQYTYAFAGWTPEVLSVTGEASYTATYSATVNTYTVIFYDEDGATVLDSREWEYGAMPEWEEPTKQPDGTHTYYFTGWTPEVVTVTSEATYSATFAADETDFGPDIIPQDGNGNPIEWPVAHGTTIYLRADLSECQTFHWSDIADPADIYYKENPRPYVYEGVLPDFSAVIETIIYHISVNSDDAAHGEAILQELDRLTTSQAQELDITCGAWYELRATASDDWHFDHWSDGDTSSVRQVEASADIQYVAYFAANCGDYPSLPVVDLYDWLLMLDVRSIHALGYTFSEEDVVWYRVQGDPDKLNDSETEDDIRVGTGYSFSLNESLVNTGDYYAMVDVSSSPSGVLCTDMMRSKIIRFAASSDASAPALAPALVRPNEPQRLIGLNPDAPTVITIYDISGHLLRTLADDGVERMDLTAEAVPGCYQLVVQNGDRRTVLRYIVIQ